MTHIVRRRE